MNFFKTRNGEYINLDTLVYACPAVEEVFTLVSRLEKESADTLSEDYQVLAEILDVFRRRAVAQEEASDA